MKENVKVTGYRVYWGKNVSKWFQTRKAAEDFYRQDDTATWITEEKEEKIKIKERVGAEMKMATWRKYMILERNEKK